MTSLKSLIVPALLCVLVINPSVGASEIQSAAYQWKSPGHQYVDPTSFFSLHGYIDGVFASTSRQWTAADPAQIGGPGQLLVPNSNQSGFQYDTALFIGSEVSERTRLVSEIHFVSDPSGTGAAGPGGITVAFTEANVSWDFVPTYLIMSGGLFWSPFGLVGKDWLGAQNLFTLVPRASGAFPTHFNERGVRFHGAKSLSERTGVNYVISVGNGVQAFDLSGQSSTDQNNNKTTTARVGVFPGLGEILQVGLSYARGQLRDLVDLTKTAGDPKRYQADFHAMGVDAVLKKGRFESRTYGIYSKEKLDRIPGGTFDPADLKREGVMTEASFRIPVQETVFGIQMFVPKARFDWVRFESLDSTGMTVTPSRSAVSSVGVNVHQNDHVYLSFEFHVQDELGRAEISNNRFITRLTGEF